MRPTAHDSLACHARPVLVRRRERPWRENHTVSDFIEVDTEETWLSDDDLATVRGRVPMVYVDAVPVRVDSIGEVTHIGLLLRAMADGTISRALVTGRVVFGERIRHALLRHLEKDLGPMALPRLPANPTPFTVAEYFPDPTVSGYHDPRQHAVSLAYIVPIDGEASPAADALDLAWVTPEEAMSPEVIAEMTGGHDRLLRLALGHTGQLP
jgi:ADP-ribose pyrophosphatase YjhB (NUDIX family)